MSKPVASFLVSALLMFALPHLLEAQAGDVHDHARAVCGMQMYAGADMASVLATTQRLNPAVYQHIVERNKRGGESIASIAAQQHTFFVLNRVTGGFDEVEAKLVFTGRRARLWMDLRDTTRIKATTVTALARGLDTATAATSRNPKKGLIENDEEVFGQPPTNRFDVATPMVEDFLLTDIQDNIAGGNILGFFFPYDQSTQGGSNEMNLLYIDSREGLGSQSAASIAMLIGTLAHEYQHLIHYKQYPNSQSFFNEGCSEAASIICGYRDRSNSEYMLSTNVPLLRWSDGSVYADLEIDYERAMSFTRYCFEQYGEAYLTKLTAANVKGMNRVATALTQIGSSATWQNTLKGYNVANFVRKNWADSQYVFEILLSNSTPKLTNAYTDTLPPSGQATMQQYAPVYTSYSFKSPGSGMTIKFNSSQTYAVMALLYQGGLLAEVRELTPNVANTIRADVGYSRIVYCIVNLSSSAQTVTWNVTALPSGVEEEAATGGALAITSVTPNPARGPVSVAFRSATREPVSLRMFDLQGRLMRTIVDAEMMEPGDHATQLDATGLAAGVYLIRMTQGARVVSRAVVVE